MIFQNIFGLIFSEIGEVLKQTLPFSLSPELFQTVAKSLPSLIVITTTYGKTGD